MREWLLRKAPDWSVTGLWVIGMFASGTVVVFFFYVAYVSGHEVLYPEEDRALGTLLIGVLVTLAVIGASARLAYAWWQELQRWREVARRT